MEINKIDALRLSNISENEKVFVSLVNDGRRIVIEPISSLDEDFVEDESIDSLEVGQMIRSFTDDEETPEDFMLIVRMK